MPTVSITRPPWLEELKKSDGTFYFEPLRNPNKNFSINVINAIEYFYNHEQVRTPTELCKRMPQITPGAAYEALERQARKSAETVHISKIRAEVDAKWASRLAQIGELKEHRAWKKEVQHYIGELNDSGLSPSRIAENNLLALNVKQVEHILQTRLRNEIVTPVLSRITQAPWHDWQEGDVFAVRGSDDVYQYFKVTRTRRAAELVGPNDFSPLQAQRDSDAPRRKRARR